MTTVEAVEGARDWKQICDLVDTVVTNKEGLVAKAIKFVSSGDFAAEGPWTAFQVTSVNELGIPQPRVLCLSSTACYRVTFKEAAPVKSHKMPYASISLLVKVCAASGPSDVERHCCVDESACCLCRRWRHRPTR